VEFLLNEKIDSIGIASFGPIDLNPNSETYGYITDTPKKAWRYFDILGNIKKNFKNIPIGFDTDVNAPALSELKNFTNITSLAYITVGTGVGVK
jgi:fructokinase